MLSTAAFLSLAMQCAPQIHPSTMRALVKTESSFNPYAIGVVGGALPEQPLTLEQGLSAVKILTEKGLNFSIGLGQINRQHFDVKNAEKIFEPCNNLKISGKILQQCYKSALSESSGQQEALKKAFSCYYSGNFTRGFDPKGGVSYVDMVLAANSESESVVVPAIGADEQRQNKPSAPALPPPEYESWDVLREHPRYNAPTSPNHDDVDLEKNKEVEQGKKGKVV
jgi:type IV secretion system protein VirB1